MNSQAEQILRLIRDSGERGIENYKLVDISLKYSSRISELRKDGWDIRARRVYRDGKASGTYQYYLHTEDPKPAETPPTKTPKAISWLNDI